MVTQSSNVVLVLLVVLAAPSLIDASRFKKPINSSPRDAKDALKASDAKFMNDDLPADNRPNAISPKLAFGHPYPAVQEHKDYDSDYVQDQNKDGGEWATQWEYDRLRIKVRKEQKEMMEAQAKMDIEKKELEKAKEHAGWASSESETARAKENDASSKQKDAESRRAAAADEEAAAKGKAAGAGKKSVDTDCSKGSAQIQEACRDIEKEEKDVKKSEQELEDSKKQLAKEKDELQAAKKHLEDVKTREIDATYQANGREKDNANRDAASKRARREELERQKAQADADRDAARAAAREADKKEKDSQGTVAQEQAEYDAAKADYEKQRQEYLDAVKALQKAEGELNDQRRGIDQKGAIYNEPEKKKKSESKSGANKLSAVFALLAASVATLAA
eukprot:gnl/TRDRNA2_/TRDRNA2_176999_c0_seq21.p1 gnl/TRDRNA2_/TRDRNA2_176999_c0~~gnl/TRDRNA2_/TRDRNA2_176999_c0_seq21.p1  ORF type:complete len:393 (+),score=141.63 gnl/TRDRNA2_/TRDRNA2_176999_c0_seq21:41-1219(+)